MTTAILLAYLFITLAIGVYAYRQSSDDPDDFFLAGRDVGPVVLFFTLIATNFSAFFFLGFAGAGYRIGYSYYGIMSFGTALVALTIYLIGHRSWQLGKRHGYITPPELIGARTGSPVLKFLYLAVMVIFTVPYLALQPIGAGILLAQLTGGAIPEFSGAVLLSVFIVFYVFIGGMRSVAWTDLAQGMIMLVLMGAAVWVVADALGGLSEANARLRDIHPSLFSREGVGGYFTPGRWISLMLLWGMAVPMFPQMFMRFFIARRSTALRTSARCYPLVTALLFLCPVIIGVLGHLAFPDLTGKAADRILPMMLTEFAPEWLAALIMTGALAAFMSTMDSQLLAISSMVTRDVWVVWIERNASLSRQVRVGRLTVVALAVAGMIIAYQPPATIFAIATQAFSGLAILFPTTVAVLYWPRVRAGACIASIVTGETLLAFTALGWIPDRWMLGFLPVLPLTALAALIVVAGSLTKRP